MDQTRNHRRTILICLFLSIVTLAVYWPVLNHGFTRLDDNEYVLWNSHVTSGLTLENLKWSFEAGHAGNWHPLTWMSHMLDVQLFGLDARWHHLVNLLFHMANASMLFLLLQKLTGAAWRSALVAGLFALHPLHVESVAWVAERKDVLSTFFMMLTIGAYSRYVDSKGKWIWYALSLLLFALGLMSKAMLVTLPCLLLLLDFWPLQRVQSLGSDALPAGDDRGAGAIRSGCARFSFWLPLVLEKIPFFVLSAASSVITYVAQRRGGSTASMEYLAIDARVANAVASTWKYLENTVWPSKLAIFYPHPALQSSQWSDGQVALGILALVAGSLLVLHARERMPWLAAGWFWYLIALVPVIGIIQVGLQGRADRYTYIPLIGIFIAMVWTGAELAAKHISDKRWLTLAGLTLLCVMGVVARRQVNFWKNDFELFTHALEVTTKNAVAHSILALELASQGKYDLADENFRAALAADPRYGSAQYNFALSLGQRAVALAEKGELEKAVQAYQASLEVRPTAMGYSDLGAVLSRLGKTDEAITNFARALELNPGLSEVHYNLAGVLAARGDVEGAIGHVVEFVGRNSTNLTARAKLGELYLRAGKLENAAAQFEEILRQHPNVESYCNLAVVRTMQGRSKDAAASYRQAIQMAPDFAMTLNNLAWLLATTPDAQVRDGIEAVKLAERACELTNYREPAIVGTLGAAYAEAGRFPDAIKTAERAIETATAAGNAELAGKNRELLELYRSGKPYHEAPNR